MVSLQIDAGIDIKAFAYEEGGVLLPQQSSSAAVSDWRPLGPNETVYVLREVVEASEVLPAGVGDGPAGASTFQEHSLRPDQGIHVLSDIVEQPGGPQEPDLLMNRQGKDVIAETESWLAGEPMRKHIDGIIMESVRQVVRDLAPAIIERIIREEIEKLKGESG